MRVFIPTLNRQDTIKTPWAYDDMDYVVVCHSDAQRDAYLAAQPRLEPARVISSGVPTGITGGTIGANGQRKWVVEHYAKPGEWVLFADDNIAAFAGVPLWLHSEATLPVKDGSATDYGASSWNALYGHRFDRDDMDDIVATMTDRCDRDGIWIAGFATNGNPYFLGNHWRRVGYVSSKAMLWKHDPTWPWELMEHMDDYHYSAEHHRRHGRVLVNNWVIPVAGHYEPGGVGSYQSRIPYRRESVHRLVALYDGLLRPKQRKGFAPNTELAFRLTTEKQVDAWRHARET